MQRFHSVSVDNALTFLAEDLCQRSIIFVPDVPVFYNGGPEDIQQDIASLSLFVVMTHRREHFAVFF